MTGRSRIGWLSVAVLCGMALTASVFGQQIHAQTERFDGHRVVRATVTSDAQLEALLAITPDVWSHGVGIGPIDCRIPPQSMASLEATGIRYEVLIADVQRLIDEEEAQRRLDHGGFFAGFRTYDEIVGYMVDLAAMRPDIASHIIVGTSIEGRAIHGLRISGADPGDSPPAVLFNGCQHAREWISPMTTVYLADQLIRLDGTDPRITALVGSTEFFIVPVVNPDGYVYTFTTNRLWRKNRRNNMDGSFGVDLNRNWDYEWGGVGSSRVGGSDIYCGTAPFSEPETAGLSVFMVDHSNIVTQLDIHSYGQLVLYSWGFTPTGAPDFVFLSSLGSQIAGAITSVHGTPYRPGQWYSTLYPSSGIMTDWAYGARRMIAYEFELRDTGQYGFVLPPNQIVPTAEEILQGALELAEATADFGMMLDVGALNWGERANARCARATPGQRVYLVYSLTGTGSTFVPPLGVTLGLDRPALAASAIADTTGQARFSQSLPNRSQPMVIWLQGAEVGRTSNVVETQAN